MIKRFIAPLALICLFALPSLAATSSGCPTSTKNFFPAPNVAASFSNVGNTFTYTFTSLTNEKPFTNGVPGLIKYCVYPSPATNEPTTGNATATGADGSTWLFKKDPKEFGFVRPGGNKTDILLNGTSATMGTATFGTLPTDQTILLHIADPTVCKQVYPNSTAGTCFVKPSQALSCNAGDGQTGVAYNAIPFGGVNCPPSSLSFEGEGVNEFGDEVALAGNTRQLVSLNVMFSSWGCESGAWNTGDCSTTQNASFQVPITATIYAGDNCTTDGCTPGTVLATATKTFSVPFRPSADNTNCTGANAGKWFNSTIGRCLNGYPVLLTFDFPSGVFLNDNVIWTVQYNTTHSGYSPLHATCSNSGGCGYDSLNVGTMSYDNAPYAGTDISAGVVWYNYYSGPGQPTNYPPNDGFGVLTPPTSIGSFTTTPQNPPETWGTGYRPLGQIITKP